MVIENSTLAPVGISAEISGRLYVDWILDTQIPKELLSSSVKTMYVEYEI